MKKELNNFNAQPANTDHIDVQEQNKQKLICVLKQKLPMEQTASIVEENNLFPELFDIVYTEKSSIKYTCTKIIRFFSETNPKIIYPFYAAITSWLNFQNNFIKWDAIYILSNLAFIDKDSKFNNIYAEYFGLLKTPQMISAANVAANAWKFALACPSWEPDITFRLLEVPAITYLHKGSASIECNHVVCGKVLESFDKYFSMSAHQTEIVEFAKTQSCSTRKSVAKAALKFLKKYNRYV